MGGIVVHVPAGFRFLPAAPWYAAAMLRPGSSLLLVPFVLLGCSAPSGEPATGLDEAPSTSAQDVEVARVRAAFTSAPVSVSPSKLSSTSTTGVTTTWRNCTERSAKKNDTTKKTVSYVFSGNGHDLNATGTGFGKIFVTDATEGASNPPDVVGYPASVVSADDVVLDVARMTADESLVIERIVKPAVDDTFDSSVYERSVYSDPRAFAVAYVSCSVADREIDTGSLSVLYYDDCKDPAYSRAYWGGADVCRAGGRRTFLRSPQGFELRIAQPPTDSRFEVVDRYHALDLEVSYGQLTVRAWASSSYPTVQFPVSAQMLQVQFSGNTASVLVDGAVQATVPTSSTDPNPDLEISSPHATALTIW